MFSRTNIIMKERRKNGMLGKTAKGKQAEDKETEYASYEICRKSKVGEYIQAGQEFFVADMKKKKIYSSNDLRLRELSEKVDSEDTFVFKEATFREHLPSFASTWQKLQPLGQPLVRNPYAVSLHNSG